MVVAFARPRRAGPRAERNVGGAHVGRILSERRGRALLNLYPPFLFQGIRILDVGPGFRSCRVRVARSLLTRNLNGTTFGGAIYAAADPMYSLMYWQVFARRGEAVQVWLRSASARYLKPAATALTFTCRLDDREIEEAAAVLDREGRFVRTYRIDATDEAGTVCAVVDTEVYMRRTRAGQKEVSAF